MVIGARARSSRGGTRSGSNESGFTVINGSVSKDTGATSYTWDGLTPGTCRCFKVRACNTAGVSACSPPAQQDWACTTTPGT